MAAAWSIAAQVRDMLGLADRGRVLELFEKTMRGDAPAVVAGLGEMHDAGADPVVVLQDLLELTHLLTRLKVAPEAGAGNADSERAQGLAMAGKLSMASLTRAWQMLLKGLQETLAAPSPVRAAEMALIRLCYAADLPSPSDALKALQNGGTPAAAPSAAPAPRGGGGGGGAAGPPRAPQPASAVAPQPAQAAPLPNPRSFTEVVALFEARREPRLVNSPDASRARGALRAGPDRVPARADGADRPRPAAERAAGQMDRPALDRLGVERRGQADPVAAEDGQRRHAAQPRPRPIRWCRPY